MSWRSLRIGRVRSRLGIEWFVVRERRPLGRLFRLVRNDPLSGMESKKSEWMTSRKTKCESDAVVVGAPVDDALFDGFGLEALGDGLVDEGGKFCVGGEAEGDDLLDVELVDVGEVSGR